jgi:hypothetical protein
MFWLGISLLTYFHNILALNSPKLISPSLTPALQSVILGAADVQYIRSGIPVLKKCGMFVTGTCLYVRIPS